MMALANKYRRELLAARLFHTRQDFQTVVHHHVVVRRIMLLDVVKPAVLMDVNVHSPIHRVVYASAFNLVWLKHRVPFGENNRRPLFFEMLDYLQRGRKEAVCEWIF